MSILDIAGVEVGKRFAKIVRRDLGENLAEIVRRNFTDEYDSCCATHDFCDANELMAEAFKGVMGRDAEADSDPDSFIWNLAWSEARGSDFRIGLDHDMIRSLDGEGDSCDHCGSKTGEGDCSL